MDSYYVNIYNEGMIPWLNMKGPVFGLELNKGIYGLLRVDPRIIMELTTLENAKQLKEKYEAKLAEANKPVAQQADSHEKVDVTDSVVITKVEKDADDEAIDEILKEDKTVETTAFTASAPSTAKKVKKYTKTQLEKMTKAELKAILAERGYTSGPYAGKYHDTLADLISKVMKTQ